MLGPIDQLERQIQDLDRIRPAQRTAIRLHLKKAGRLAKQAIASPNALGMWFVGGVITDHLKKDEAELKGTDVDVKISGEDARLNEVRKKDVTRNRLKTLTKLVLRSFLTHKLTSAVADSGATEVVTPD